MNMLTLEWEGIRKVPSAVSGNLKLPLFFHYN